jgi:hypothetical protein
MAFGPSLPPPTANRVDPPPTKEPCRAHIPPGWPRPQRAAHALTPSIAWGRVPLSLLRVNTLLLRKVGQCCTAALGCRTPSLPCFPLKLTGREIQRGLLRLARSAPGPLHPWQGDPSAGPSVHRREQCAPSVLMARRAHLRKGSDKCAHFFSASA